MHNISASLRQFVLSALIVLAAIAGNSSFVRAADQQAVDRADRFLASTSVGKDVLSFVHFGTTYREHAYVRTMNVRDADGNVAPGHFALVYRYRWDDDGVTDVAFLCNTSGRVYQTQIISTNAILQQPFLAANAAIHILGNVVLGLPNSRLSDADRRAIQQAIDNADAKSLLELMLAIRQAI